ncbi:MAG: PIG-L deacetylase family protein, partial [Promethearchaeota archaeon]
SEARTASNILNIDVRVTLEIENRYFENTISNRKKVSEVFRKFRPKVIITHPPEDWHTDHVVTNQLVNSAKFQAKLTNTVSKFPEFYPPCIIYFDHSHIKKQRKIDFLVNISDSMEEKIKALKAYKSQFIENNSHLRLFEFIKERASYLGRQVGVRYAEGFIVPEYFLVDDITKLRV